jgi:hypothetical protein
MLAAHKTGHPCEMAVSQNLPGRSLPATCAITGGSALLVTEPHARIELAFSAWKADTLAIVLVRQVGVQASFALAFSYLTRVAIRFGDYSARTSLYRSCTPVGPEAIESSTCRFSGDRSPV